jgi:sugar phosphate isomerase/epimerase
MKRREFLTATAVAGAAVVCGTQRAAAQGAADNGMPKLTPPEKPAQLNPCLQWGTIPGGEMKQKLDFLEANGFTAVEIPSGDWPQKNCEALLEAMKGRKLFISTACGGSDFSYADPARRDAEVNKFLPTIAALGEMKAVGWIVCPARGKLDVDGHLSFTELRKDFVENTGKRLAEHAAKHGTNIVLEPLRRGETPFLRQVADGARIAADIGAGATVMGDFWHMAQEETCFMGAFICAGKLLTHVHIASLRNRQIPGMSPEHDIYVDGFKGLKLIGYQGAISLEGGFPKDCPEEEKIRLIRNMVTLMRDQWAMA